jgi:NitT/TauT family transport system permease protein
VSTSIVEPPVVTEAASAGSLSASPPPEISGLRVAAYASAPAIAAGLALAAHLLLPSRPDLPMTWLDSLPAWQHPYPMVLTALMAFALLAAGVQLFWRRSRPSVAYYAPLLAAFIGESCVYELVSTKLTWLPQPFFPGPDQILGALIENRVLLFKSTQQSLLLLLSGYAMGVVAGVVSGVLIGWFARVRYWAMPHIKLLGPIPAMALIALAMVLFANMHLRATALIAWAVWFPVTMLTTSGIANCPVSYLEVARTLGAGRLYLVFRVAIPAALPSMFVGVFMGLLVSFLALLVAESAGVESGLGYYIKWQMGYLEYGNVFAAIGIMAVLFSGLLTLLFRARDRVLVWQKGVIKW